MTRLVDIERWLATVTLGGPFAAIRLRVSIDPYDDAWRIIADWTTPCVDTGLQQVLHWMFPMPVDLPSERWDEWLYVHVIKPLVMHELDEWFRVGGQLVHDPHAHERKEKAA